MTSTPGIAPAVGAPEQLLVQRAGGGDVSAFEELVNVHADRLFSVILRIVGDRAEAEDVAQETLVRAWRNIGRFQERSMFFTWLYRIAVNESNRALEKRSRRGISVPVDDETVQLAAPAKDSPARQLEQRELRDGLEIAIASLAPPYRTALVLRDIEGLSTREAAGVAGVGEAAFKSRLHQARMKIRDALGDAALIASIAPNLP